MFRLSIFLVLRRAVPHSLSGSALQSRPHHPIFTLPHLGLIFDASGCYGSTRGDSQPPTFRWTIFHGTRYEDTTEHGPAFVLQLLMVSGSGGPASRHRLRRPPVGLRSVLLAQFSPLIFDYWGRRGLVVCGGYVSFFSSEMIMMVNALHVGDLAPASCVMPGCRTPISSKANNGYPMEIRNGLDSIEIAPTQDVIPIRPTLLY